MKIVEFLQSADFNRPNQEIFADLLFLAMGYRLDLTKVVLGKPVTLDQRPGIADDSNAFLPMQIDEDYDDRFKGHEGCLYYRIPIEILTRVTPLSFVVPPQYPFKTHEVLDQLNARLGVQLTEQDLVNLEYADSSTPFVLQAHPDSLVWNNLTLPELAAADDFLLTQDGQGLLYQDGSAIVL